MNLANSVPFAVCHSQGRTDDCSFTLLSLAEDNGIGTNFGVGVGEARPEGREWGMGFLGRG